MQFDLRRPITVEDLVDACVAKMADEAKENSDTVVDIVLGPEVMMELALRVMALEAHLGLMPPSNASLAALRDTLTVFNASCACRGAEQKQSRETRSHGL